MKELFKKFIKRECSKEEIEQIVEYFKNSEEFHDIPTVQEIKHLLEQYPEMEQLSANRIYKHVLDVSKALQKPRHKKSHVWYYSAAALLVGVLAASYYLKDNLLSKQDNIPTIVNTSIIEPGTNKATLTLEDGSVVALEKGNAYKIHNASSNGEEIIYNTSERNPTEIKYNFLTIPRGGQFHLILSDGTEVWLNSESQLKYPVSFIDGETRKVELVYGEAYFDVSHSTEHKGSHFIVYNNKQEVEVLGTEFNIKAYKEENNIYTTLVKGRVKVSNSVSNQYLLPNQQSIINLNNKDIIIQKIDAYSETSWRKGLFSFKGKTLEEIMIVLSRWYDVNVEFENPEVEKVKFNGVLSKNDSIEEILRTIKNTNFITAYEIKDKKIIIK